MNPAENDIVQILLDEFESVRTPKNVMNMAQFYKDMPDTYVLRSNIVRAISQRRYQAIRSAPKDQRLLICQRMLDKRQLELNSIAVDWACRSRSEYVPIDFNMFERWLKTYVRGWGLCDSLCAGPIGMLINDYPALAPRVKKWLASRNKWLRRGGAVSLIPAVRAGKLLPLAFEVADTLLLDKEDLVQKGYGWLLKEATKCFRQEVYEFVLERRETMPRTALRYAIEKLPSSMKREAMKKPL